MERPPCLAFQGELGVSEKLGDSISGFMSLLVTSTPRLRVSESKVLAMGRYLGVGFRGRYVCFKSEALCQFQRHKVGLIPESMDRISESPLIEPAESKKERDSGSRVSERKESEVIGDVWRISDVLRSDLKSHTMSIQPAPIAITGKVGWIVSVSERSNRSGSSNPSESIYAREPPLQRNTD